MRVWAGVSLIHVERFSPWLYVVTTLLALYIGFGKRRAELALLEDNASNHRRVLEGYTIPFLDQLITIVSGTTIVSYSFYTFSAPNVPANHTMMLTIPFVLYGIFRYLYLVQVKMYGRGARRSATERPSFAVLHCIMGTVRPGSFLFLLELTQSCLLLVLLLQEKSFYLENMLSSTAFRLLQYR